MKKLLLVLLALPLIGFGQNVNIPDANFKAYLLGNTAINTNGDTEIQVAEATAFNGAINCSWMSISNLTGIEAFTALTWLECSYNQLTSLNVSQNTALNTLYCSGNQLTSLNVSQNTALTFLNCWGNLLTSLDVSQNTALTELYCNENQLTSLDVSQNTALTYLVCVNNQLTSLDVSQNTALIRLYCYNNQLTSLDVSQNTALTELYCGANDLTSLDVSNNIYLNQLSAASNPLISLNVQNGNNTNLYCDNIVPLCCGGIQLITSLSCIQVDDIVWAYLNWTTSIDTTFQYFSTNCSVPSAIQEHTTNKELLKVTDLLGRETKKTNQLLFYIYNDGTVEKKVVIE